MNKLIFILLFSLTLLSCNNDDTFNTNRKEIEISLNSKYSQKEMLSIVSKVGRKLERSTLANGTVNITESQAKQMIQPLVADGKLMQKQMLNQVKDLDYVTDSDIKEIENMTDEELASLSFIIAITQKYEEPDFNNVDGRKITSKDICWDKIKPCLLSALGVGGLKNIYNTIIIKGGVTTAELLPILKIIGKRYCAYTSLAFFIWDTVDCLHGYGVI